MRSSLLPTLSKTQGEINRIRRSTRGKESLGATRQTFYWPKIRQKGKSPKRI